MLDMLITSITAFILMLVPSFSNHVTNPPITQITITFTGDIMLGRSVMGASLDKDDPYYSFRKTSDFLKNTDITFGNLENPIVEDCKRHVGGFKFCTTPEIAKSLTFSGFDIVTIANNHTNNYGKEGFEETKKYLNNDGVKSVGYGNLGIIEKNGTKFGFLGFDLVSNQFSASDQQLITDSDSLVDVLIIGPHWGTEYQAIANKLQITIAEQMVESGADVVIGHHPHWVQNYEEINGVPVYYSLGNFIFDQMWSEETKKGLVIKITFEGKNIVKTEEFKTYIPLIGQPVFEKGV
ncbi:MAG: hypothetical protein ACD_19C00426G0066 [uncultured bacterium]|nr:MAG: hypothetical protein ACD_19C00426G0066 [uncultured bacterium]